LRDDRREALSPARCPEEVTREALDVCLAAVREERCGDAAAGFAGLRACAPSKVCTP
jgi:hypothetical protein